jgi:hypothetical protein
MRRLSLDPRRVSMSHLALATAMLDDRRVETWEPFDDATLMMQVLQRMEAQLLDIGENVVHVRALLEDEDGEEEEEDQPEP